MIYQTAQHKTDLPLKPTAITNYKTIDAELAKIVGNFWKYTWNNEDSAFAPKDKYLLSLANATGALRFRQATRELLKAYATGVTIRELDEIFALLAWNQGIGTFSSEIGPSTLFQAYKMIKEMESNGQARELILKKLVEKFGEENPLVSTLPKK